jgi:multidrug efflux system outer membrane protein
MNPRSLRQDPEVPWLPRGRTPSRRLARTVALVSAVLMVAIGGCAAPTGRGTEGLPAVPGGWTMAPATAAATRGAAEGGSAPSAAIRPQGAVGPWWLAVDDPVLHRLLEQAGEVASVRIARERMDEAFASLRAARAVLAPAITGAAGTRLSAPGDGAVRQSIQDATLGIGHDFDLSGANRARAEAARALADARAEAVDAARIAAREMAVQLYAAYTGAAAQRRITQQSVLAFESALALTATRSRAGLGTQLDVVQAQAALASARALLPRFEAARDSARLGLEALLGLLPGALSLPLAAIEATPDVDPSLLLRTPLEVVAARPDLRMAERELAAASAATAAAVRDRWPRLSLDALVGVQAVRVPGPMSADGLVSSLFAGIAGPLFDAGRLAARADAARARERAAAIAYRQAALVALGEVEDGISRFTQAHAEDALGAAAVAAAQARVEIARSRWRSGLTAFLDVVLAEQALQATQAQHVLSRVRTLDSFARLSAAIGAGG